MPKNAGMRFIPLLLLALLGLVALWLVVAGRDAVEREARRVEVGGVRLFMTREEVERLHGPGPDDSPGCFGCEMNFIYPQLKLSGRYSETMDRMKGKTILRSRSPKVKQLTTSDPAAELLGIRIGDTIGDAVRALESKGFKRQRNRNEPMYNYYHKGDVYIRLWPDAELRFLHKDQEQLGKEDEPVRSITLEWRVRSDEQIQY